MKPILKWAGSKQQLLPELKKYVDLDKLCGHVFYEPFIGGGALAFDLGYKYTTISDLNPELVNLYKVIRDEPEGLIKELKNHQAFAVIDEFAEDHYYEVRAWDRDKNFDLMSPVMKAARTIYLNKTCFNGLYRVNLKGYFNTPIGRTSNGKCPDIVNAEAIRELSIFLKGVRIREGDYAEAIKDAEPGDIIYFDPPYDPDEAIKTVGFVGYQKEGWSRDDTIRLKSVCDTFTRKGCKIILSNNDTAFIRELFKDYNIHEVDVRRSINRNGDNRKGKEVIITNF
jgi:DNA adenine methylase